MAWQRNEGRKRDEVLQNKVTACQLSAVQRRKALYMDTLMKAQQIFHLIEETAMDSTFELEHEALQGIPLYMQIQNKKLQWSLSHLTERERFGFFNRALDERSLDELAAELGLSYKGVAAIFYRAIQKIKRK